VPGFYPPSLWICHCHHYPATTTTMTEMELSDRIVHPYRYVEEATSNDTEIRLIVVNS
jgi:hypothetical protein